MYSFAIILQEFHTREGPYSANFMEPKGRFLLPLYVSAITFLLSCMYVFTHVVVGDDAGGSGFGSGGADRSNGRILLVVVFSCGIG